ncbi:SIR2 family protein [Myroides odoratimimus]|uniref:SIR2 family protein n=1 Tax=Myroides odoratimimus TaxID=76832 RepID=UPI002578D5B1|nr:SIR2 family protein [Myroides odoratimimus]MDM1410561.1 SIR2 family protein [Myroides odoratimimus]
MSIIYNQGGQSVFTNTDDSTDKKIEIIKGKIQELFNMKNICFLFGAGTSSAAIPIMSDLFKQVTSKLEQENNKALKTYFEKLNQEQINNNLEEVLGLLYSEHNFLKSTLTEDKLKENPCVLLIKLIEEEIFTSINININASENENVLETYKAFYQKVTLRNKDLARINVFTTNNDLFNEYAMDSLNINYINGFSGGLTKLFNPGLFNYTFSKRMDTSIEKFEPVENMVYLYKIHGSINWTEDENNTNSFFKIKEIPYSKDNNPTRSVLVYPAPTKQNKSLGSPYVEMFREFQKKLLEQHTVLFVIGYSFSDEHINNIIYQALAINSTINVVIFGNVKGNITKITDNRIINIYGELTSSIIQQTDESTEQTNINTSKPEKIHYFKYMVDNFIPDVNLYKKQDDVLADFIKQYKELN